jgi:hypothetical protein
MNLTPDERRELIEIRLEAFRAEDYDLLGDCEKALRGDRSALWSLGFIDDEPEHPDDIEWERNFDPDY